MTRPHKVREIRTEETIQNRRPAECQFLLCAFPWTCKRRLKSEWHDSALFLFSYEARLFNASAELPNSPGGTNPFQICAYVEIGQRRDSVHAAILPN